MTVISNPLANQGLIVRIDYCPSHITAHHFTGPRKFKFQVLPVGGILPRGLDLQSQLGTNLRGAPTFIKIS